MLKKSQKKCQMRGQDLQNDYERKIVEARIKHIWLCAARRVIYRLDSSEVEHS